MVKSILSSPQETVLENALSASALRHKVISNNIANVNTPGYKRADVSFDDILAETMKGPEVSRTDQRHFGGRSANTFSPYIANDSSTTMRADGNNVDIEIEMDNLAKNNIYYDAVAQTLRKYYSNIMSAIKEGK